MIRSTQFFGKWIEKYKTNINKKKISKPYFKSSGRFVGIKVSVAIWVNILMLCRLSLRYYLEMFN